MKKLKLNSDSLFTKNLLNRSSLKHIIGGYGDTSEGGCGSSYIGFTCSVTFKEGNQTWGSGPAISCVPKASADDPKAYVLGIYKSNGFCTAEISCTVSC